MMQKLVIVYILNKGRNRHNFSKSRNVFSSKCLYSPLLYVWSRGSPPIMTLKKHKAYKNGNFEWKRITDKEIFPSTTLMSLNDG